MSTPAPAPYRNRDAWHAARRRGIGGSDIAALFGLHPYKTAHRVWEEKTGKPLPEERETPDMRRGRRLEDIAAELYTERTGRRVRRQPLRVHPEHAFLIASIDRQALSGYIDGNVWSTTRALELKVPRTRTFYRLRREGLPDYIILQGQHEALVWGYDLTEYGIYGPDDDEILTFEVGADDAVAERIINVAGEFWHHHVEKDVPPPETIPRVEVELPLAPGVVLRREDEEFARAASEYEEARELEAEAKTVKDLARDKLLALCPTVAAYEGGGFRVYHGKQDGRRSFQRAALEAYGALDPIRVASWLTEYAKLTTEQAADVLSEGVLDLSQFEKVGAGFETVKVYRLRGED